MTGTSEPTPVEPDATLGVFVPCEGQCPGAPGILITCEGACSGLTTRWLARRLMPEGGRRPPRLGPPRGALLSLLAAASLLGQPQAGAAVVSKTASYSFSVVEPAPVKAGGKASAVIRVVPHGPYHINIEFPLKLKLSGPVTASPREVLLTKKQAAKLTKDELSLKPEFTLSSPGKHVIQGTLRFSVCTDAQCEIKIENVAFTAISR